MHLPTFRLWWLATPLIAAGCATDPESLTASTSAITSVIPTSTSCNQGLAPKQCVQVAVFEGPDTSHWVINGTRGALEYAGATEIPFTTDHNFTGIFGRPPLRGNGRVHVQRVTQRPASPLAITSHYLYLFLEDIAVPVSSGVIDSKVAVHVDNLRFDGTSANVTDEDRRFTISLAATGVTVHKPSGTGASTTWTSVTTPSGTSFAPGGCVVDGSGTSARCKGELRIPLIASAVSAPGTGLDPGVGLLVRHATIRGSAPEIAAAEFATSPWKRTQWPTLLFSRPKGFDLKVMTWNVRRFDPLFESQGFGDVKLEDIGAYLAKNDIVAIQEGWDRAQVTAILDAANTARASANLPKFHLYGPVDYEPAWREVVQSAVDVVSDTQGGLYVMSHLPLGTEGYKVFPSSMCRGEDCFKAKGVQWVRLLLQDPATVDPRCLKNEPLSCDKLPSGDDYVDVFNTHLQADDPLLCVPDGDWSSVKSGIFGALSLLGAPWLAVAVDEVFALVEADLNCTTLDDRTARSRQLAAINQFIEDRTDGQKDRPVLVMGDFNIDGKRISGAEYRDMLVALHIASPSTPDSDAISVLPANAFDVKHGDLARARSDFDTTSGTCFGTFIGETGGNANTACTLDGKFDGDSRLDYILLRPPVLPKDATDDPRWYAASGKRVWSSPFPSLSGNPATSPPARLSDHKPVVSDISLVRLSNPPAFHPTWPHDVELRVMSVNATDIDDCYGCGEVDPFAQLRARVYPAAQLPSFTTNECTGSQAPMFGDDYPCMNNWHRDVMQTPPQQTGVGLLSKVRDDDNTSSDDTLQTVRSSFMIDMSNSGLLAGMLDMVSFFGSTELPGAPWPMAESAPLFRCAGIGVTVCHRITLTEIE